MDTLTGQQLSELQQALLALKKLLLRQLNDSREGSKPVSLDEPIGRLSRMDAMQQQHMVQANRRTAQIRLSRVDAAIRRCETGDYGMCLDCDEEIGFDRLRAQPETPFCLNCQTQRESSRN
jgi:DnaK suppressor protein